MKKSWISKANASATCLLSFAQSNKDNQPIIINIEHVVERNFYLIVRILSIKNIRQAMHIQYSPVVPRRTEAYTLSAPNVKVFCAWIVPRSRLKVLGARRDSHRRGSIVRASRRESPHFLRLFWKAQPSMNNNNNNILRWFELSWTKTGNIEKKIKALATFFSEIGL